MNQRPSDKLLKTRINRLIKSTFIVTNLFLSAGIASGQQDFNHFNTLKAVGAMPADFSVSTKEKIANDRGTRNQLSKKKEKIFLEGIHYSIDEMLHSGLVIYGDEISTYVAKVAGNLLKNDEALRSKLRFYTIKSNATNAFSTDQGIVFVTTGLISQLATESQLAYVLAHEISHYTQHHVVETFEIVHDKKYHDRIFKMSTYSKEKEFEADKLGIKLYCEAGYSKDELPGTFDVLLYSYLPFDDIEVPASYFNTELAFVPEKFFPKKAYPIKAEEDREDKNSSHPNIKKRKEAAGKETIKYANWGNEVFVFGEAEFKYIRDISRFESVRTDIIDGKFVDALYSIFILEKNYPASVYLAKMKAHAWLGFAQIAYDNSTRKAIMSTNNLEGEIATMHFVFGKISKSAIGTLALRNITDIRAKHPGNPEIELVWKKAVRATAYEKDFALNKFADKPFRQASLEFIALRGDTVAKADSAAARPATKYDKIRKKKDANLSSNFDSTNYELYMLSDLTGSEEFKNLYTEFKLKSDVEQQEKDSLKTMNKKERRRYYRSKEKNHLNQGINDLIVIQPTAVIIKGKDNFSPEKSLKAEENMLRCIRETGEALDMNLKIMNTTSEFIATTDDFNNRSRIFSYLEQNANNNYGDIFPIDYEDLNLIKSKYKTSNVGFMRYTHDYEVNGAWFFSIIVGFFPIMVTYPEVFAYGFKGEFSFVVVDITTGDVVISHSEKVGDANTKNAVRARIYNVFANLQTTPKTKKKS